MSNEKKESLITERSVFQAILSNKEVQEMVAKTISCTSLELEEFLKRKTCIRPKLSVYTDGGARGNPGISGCGVVIDDGTTKKGYFYYLGIHTNNFAEYTGLLKALSLVKEMNAQDVTVYSDSELMCRQIAGVYKVKNPQLLVLYKEAMVFIQGLKAFKIEHVRRECNKDADNLANMAMDEKRNGEVEFTTAVS